MKAPNTALRSDDPPAPCTGDDLGDTAGVADFAVTIPSDESGLSPEEARAANEVGAWPVRVSFPSVDDGVQFIADARFGAAQRTGAQAAGAIIGLQAELLGQLHDAVTGRLSPAPAAHDQKLADAVQRAVRAAMVAPSSDMITRHHLALVLDVDPKTIATYVERDGLPAHGLGRNQYFFRSEVEQWLKDRGSKPGAHADRHALSMARLRNRTAKEGK